VAARPDSWLHLATQPEGARLTKYHPFPPTSWATPYNLAELRKMRSVTQAELAHQLGVAQPSLSALEHRGDVQLSTLRQYIEGHGGHLEVSAVFDDVRIPVTLFVE
jgi:DNA-binding XRE family transcriptional regulator